MTYTIRAFRGFGSARTVFINGQVTRGAIDSADTQASQLQRGLWQRSLDAMKLAVTPRIPRARVRIDCAGVTTEKETDRHGHFFATLRLDEREANAPWQHYQVHLTVPASTETVACVGEVLIPDDFAERIVVSDIDDTVIYTGVANKLMMLWRLFAHGADDKVPFPGICGFYRSLYRGPDDEQRNPIIYVSRSPWSIYPVLDAFFLMHDIPIGPVLQLREWGISWRHPFPRRARSHKAEVLDRVAQCCPEYRLLLIGDSGQKDPELYRDFALRFPQRVEAIYLRSVDRGAKRAAELEKIRSELAELDVPMVVAKTTEEMAFSARIQGYISEEALISVRRDSAVDKP